ncbi:multiple inositol polyphosphate phosphatase 1-like [Penaeus japonicus]|uniref:multiple inositol polyphosphate phosphatase 1-like n=1 Tax=Penaeus japonicus TaxID=27405 RepID=UPI001C717392|nr:multiple inositol polyphosphate phosphatase 1-like [Penaeus japonicus]
MFSKCVLVLTSTDEQERKLDPMLRLRKMSVNFLLALIIGTYTVNSEQCLSENKNPYLYFASKTAYDTVRGDITKEFLALRESGCEVRSVCMLLRHGSRHPTGLDLALIRLHMASLKERILKAHGLGLGSLCQKDIDLLKQWTGKELEYKLRMKLFESGKSELERLGARMRTALPHFFSEDALNSRISIWSTDTNRTKESARAFLKGFCPSQDLARSIVSKRANNILEFSETCQKYVDKVLRGRSARRYMKFLDEAEMNSVIHNVSKRLNISVGKLHVLLMYNVCRYYKAMEPGKVSAWCAVFSTTDFKILEYAEDLISYHDHGYEFDIMHKLACPLIEDIIHHFRSQIVNDTEPSSSFYVSHIETVIKAMVGFGLFNDSHAPTHSHMDPNRLWQTSLFGGFASNLLLVLTKCPGDRWSINTFVNERRIPLPKCESPGGCPWSRFLQIFEEQNCHFNDLCKNGYGVYYKAIFWRAVNYLSVYDGL